MEKKKINIIEVGPRDGFQSVRGDFIPTELKKEIIDLLVDAGVKHLEYTSFVSPKAIPQLADAAEVSEYVLSKYPDLDLMVLVRVRCWGMAVICSLPMPGWSISGNIPRAPAIWGSTTRRSMVFTGQAGQPASLSILSTSSMVCFWVHGQISARRAS